MPGKRKAQKKSSSEKKKKAESSKLRKAVCTAFHTAQKSNASHSRMVSQLIALEKKDTSDSFLNEVWYALQWALTSKEYAAVDRVMKMTEAYLTKRESTQQASWLLDKALSTENCEHKDIRRNSCELVTCCMMALSKLRTAKEKAAEQQPDGNEPEEEEEFDEFELYDKIASFAHDRQDDKAAAVRAKAVDCSYLLQCPSSAQKCDITQHYHQLMSCDTAPVRLAVLTRLALSQHVIKLLITHTLDISLQVRKLAYRHLARIPPTWLILPQRRALLARGLNERSDEIRKTTQELIGNWLQRYSSTDVLQLIDIDEDEELCEQIAETIFEVKFKKAEGPDEGVWDLEQRRLLCEDFLSAESILLLRSVIKKIKEFDPDGDRSDRYLPNIDFTSAMLQMYIDGLTMEEPTIKTSLAKQLLKLALLYEPDLHTEDQRARIMHPIFIILQMVDVSAPTQLAAESVRLCRHFYRHRESEFSRMISIVIFRLNRMMSTQLEDDDQAPDKELFFDAEQTSRDDLAKQQKIIELNKKCIQLERLISDSRSPFSKKSLQQVNEHDEILEAAESELTRLQTESSNDVGLWVRILEIITETARHDIRPSHAVQIVHQHQDIAVTVSQTHCNTYVRTKGIHALTYFGLLQKQAAETFSKILLDALRKSAYPNVKALGTSCTPPMQEALRGLTDLIMEHGTKAIIPSRDAITRVIVQFASTGDHSFGGEDVDIATETPSDVLQRRVSLRATAVQCLTKLLSCNRLSNGEDKIEKKALAQLMLYFFEKSDGEHSEDREHALQVLAVFFDVFPYSSFGRLSLCLESVLLALRHIAREDLVILKDPDIQTVSSPETKKSSSLFNMHTNFLAFAAGVTDVAEMGLVRKSKGDDEDEKKTAVVTKEMKSQSLHEDLALWCLLEFYCELAEKKGEIDNVRRLIKILSNIKLYNTTIPEVEENAPLPPAAYLPGVTEMVITALKTETDKQLKSHIQKFKSSLKSLKGPLATEEEIMLKIEQHRSDWEECIPHIEQKKSPRATSGKTSSRRVEKLRLESDTDDESLEIIVKRRKAM
eukprot:TRINITY_DN7570_c0_g1_i1.p1 TRINITY_DN7570_c0_g1~~TRINITY_DN7570_c0_g1_i1.p1  ORF type:complete len:1055 (+),score=221.76 TRINITY_DN7570_c0_g1_i1:46-3210(+)